MNYSFKFFSLILIMSAPYTLHTGRGKQKPTHSITPTIQDAPITSTITLTSPNEPSESPASVENQATLNSPTEYTESSAFVKNQADDNKTEYEKKEVFSLQAPDSESDFEGDLEDIAKKIISLKERAKKNPSTRNITRLADLFTTEKSDANKADNQQVVESSNQSSLETNSTDAHASNNNNQDMPSNTQTTTQQIAKTPSSGWFSWAWRGSAQ